MTFLKAITALAKALISFLLLPLQIGLGITLAIPLTQLWHRIFG